MYDFPSTPSVGQAFGQYKWNGYAWVPVASGGGLTVSDTPPASPIDGMLWWESDTGKLFVRYNDGVGPSQWVEAVAVPAVDTSGFVKKAGDVMSGELINQAGVGVIAPAPYISLIKPPGGSAQVVLEGGVGTQPDWSDYKSRWQILLGDAAPEGAGNTGSNLNIFCCDNNGEFLGSALMIDRASQQVLIDKAPTDPKSAATKQYVDARALDVMAYSGMQVNGSMEVSQERGTGQTTNSGTFICDGWRLYGAGSFTVAAGQSMAAPIAFGISGVMYCLTTGAQTSIAADNYLNIQQQIEGYRIARLAWGSAAARPITIAFWSMHNRPGVYSFAINNESGDRCYTTSYTHNASDVTQFNVITIPGCTDGVWKKDHTNGMTLVFSMAGGSNYVTATTNTWMTSNYKMVASGQVNGVGATTDVFRISGVIVVPGIYAPTAAQSPLIMRPFPQELSLCKRYYEKSYNYDTLPGAAVGAGSNGLLITMVVDVGGTMCMFPYEVEKRSAPTTTYFDGAGTTGSGSMFTGTAWVNGGCLVSNPGSSANKKMISVFFTGFGASVYGGCDFVADARL